MYPQHDNKENPCSDFSENSKLKVYQKGSYKYLDKMTGKLSDT